MKIFSRYFLLLFIHMGFFGSLIAQIPDTPEKPKLQTSVYDDAGLLSSDQKNALEYKLIQYADSTSTQIVVVSVLTTNGDDIGYFATQFAQKWGIGQKDKDNGIIIMVAKDDRKMSIRTGYGVEHLLTDALSRRIIENIMVPNFKQGNYYAGLNDATDIIMQIMSGEYKAETTANFGGSLVFIVILIFFIVITIIVSSSKNKGNNKGGRSIIDDDIFGPIILSRGGRGTWGGGWSSGGSGGFGGGGFGGGFGGGGFGGGGASGSW